jgi:hypothetical protein
MIITADFRRCDGVSRRALTLNSFQCQQDLLIGGESAVTAAANRTYLWQQENRLSPKPL